MYLAHWNLSGVFHFPPHPPHTNPSLLACHAKLLERSALAPSFLPRIIGHTSHYNFSLSHTESLWFTIHKDLLLLLCLYFPGYSKLSGIFSPNLHQINSFSRKQHLLWQSPAPQLCAPRGLVGIFPTLSGTALSTEVQSSSSYFHRALSMVGREQQQTSRVSLMLKNKSRLRDKQDGHGKNLW